MKDNYSHIAIVLDRSGSMSSVKEETISGLNNLFKEQQILPGVNATVSLVQFDDKYEVNYEFKDLQKVPMLTNETYVPRGYTALLDAIGKTIVSTGERLAAIPESSRPAKVIFVIQTDGIENASREYTRERIKEMITHQKEKYFWEFIFLGAGQDAITVGASYGINAKSSLSYTSSNTTGSFKSTSSYVSGALCARSAADFASLSYSDKDRADAVAPSNVPIP